VRDLFIYFDFEKEVSWIKRVQSQEYATFPGTLSKLADYYLRKRLDILGEKSLVVDRRLGRPFPYMAFWFADSFGLANSEDIRKLALSLVYISICVSARDDLVDAKLKLNGRKAATHALICLTDLYYNKYFQIFKALLPPSSRFWYIMSNCFNDWESYEAWSFLFNSLNDFDPLSQHFLKKSSQYLLAITLPTIAATAFLTNNESKIPQITRFLRYYWMGWKMVDDIKDWKRDINTPKFSHSSVIHHAIKKYGMRNKLTERNMQSMFLSKNYVNEIYSSLLGWYKKAQHNLSSFDSKYLEEFMNSQIQLHRDERNLHLNRIAKFNEGIKDLLLREGS
jgi:hypothetical protein